MVPNSSAFAQNITILFSFVLEGMFCHWIFLAPLVRLTAYSGPKSFPNSHNFRSSSPTISKAPLTAQMVS